MISGMAPVLDKGPYHFCISDDAALLPRAIATFREDEGLTLILPEPAALTAGLAGDQPMARITLTVHSALDGVGLTAAVSGALAEAGIPCNMVAAYHHDHAFVPVALADQAMEILQALAARSG